MRLKNLLEMNFILLILSKIPKSFYFEYSSYKKRDIQNLINSGYDKKYPKEKVDRR
jgi:hypothetical protein